MLAKGVASSPASCAATVCVGLSRTLVGAQLAGERGGLIASKLCCYGVCGAEPYTCGSTACRRKEWPHRQQAVLLRCVCGGLSRTLVGAQLAGERGGPIASKLCCYGVCVGLSRTLVGAQLAGERSGLIASKLCCYGVCVCGGLRRTLVGAQVAGERGGLIASKLCGSGVCGASTVRPVRSGSCLGAWPGTLPRRRGKTVRRASRLPG